MKNFFKLLSLCIILSPALVFAADYTPLVGIPGVDDANNFNSYMQAIYATSISLAALLAVIKIVIAGVKWMTTDIVEGKSDAKKDIQGAIFGLVVILAAVLILYIINPNIGAVNLEFKAAPKPALRENDATLTPLENCITAENCNAVSCASTVPSGPVGPGPRAGITYNCAAAEDRCLGTFVDVGTGRGTCTATAAEIEASLAEIANANCPSGRDCRASLCESRSLGMFESCEEQCVETRNGISYDNSTGACIAYNDSYDTSTDIDIDESVTYTTKLNDDQLAAGETAQTLTIISTTSENGFITVEYPDGSQAQLSCGAIVPSLCE